MSDCHPYVGMMPTYRRRDDPYVGLTLAFMIDPDSGVPVWRQLANTIRSQIERGELRPGQRLRTEPEYMDEYDLGRTTVRQAIATLRAEGVITTTRSGSRVRGKQPMAEVRVDEQTRINTRMPTDAERRQWALPEGVPVFVVSRPNVEPEVLAGDRITLVVG